MRGKNIIYIGNSLASRGYCPTSADILPVSFRKMGFNIATYSSRENIILRLFDMVCGIILKHKSFDLAIIDTYSTKNFWFAFICSRLCVRLGLPYIPVLHGGELPQRMNRSPKMAKLIFSNSYQNVTPSEYLKEALVSRGYSGVVIPNAIEINQYKFKHRKIVAPKLLFVRAFDKIYNPTMALRVLKEILKTFPDATLCMVGPDKDGSMAECKALATKFKLESNLKISGRLTKNEWVKLSEGYDIFLNTTHKDNTPVSVIEAMALGLPVVSTNPGGLSFLIQDNHDGLLVSVDDVKGMVDRISWLVENPEKASKLSVAARAKVENYCWDRVQLKWLELLDPSF